MYAVLYLIIAYALYKTSRSHTGNMHVAMQCSHARSHAILQYYSHKVMQSLLFWWPWQIFPTRWYRDVSYRRIYTTCMYVCIGSPDISETNIGSTISWRGSTMDIETTGVRERSKRMLMNLRRYIQHLYTVNIRAWYFWLIYDIKKYIYNLYQF